MTPVDYARRFTSTPYFFGGNNPITGMDCSGFVCEVLRAFGLVRAFEDLTAQMLYDKFVEKHSIPKPQQGSLLFFGENRKKITHVAMATNSWQMIEAGGGDARTRDLATAAKQNAFVRERPIGFRRDLVEIVMPPWPAEV